MSMPQEIGNDLGKIKGHGYLKGMTLLQYIALLNWGVQLLELYAQESFSQLSSLSDYTFMGAILVYPVLVVVGLMKARQALKSGHQRAVYLWPLLGCIHIILFLGSLFLFTSPMMNDPR